MKFRNHSRLQLLQRVQEDFLVADWSIVELAQININGENFVAKHTLVGFQVLYYTSILADQSAPNTHATTILLVPPTGCGKESAPKQCLYTKKTE